MMKAKLGRLDLTLLVALNVDSGNLVVKLSTADSAVIPPIETEVLVFNFNCFLLFTAVLAFPCPALMAEACFQEYNALRLPECQSDSGLLHQMHLKRAMLLYILCEVNSRLLR